MPRLASSLRRPTKINLALLVMHGCFGGANFRVERSAPGSTGYSDECCPDVGCPARPLGTRLNIPAEDITFPQDHRLDCRDSAKSPNEKYHLGSSAIALKSLFNGSSIKRGVHNEIIARSWPTQANAPPLAVVSDYDALSPLRSRL